ncbi:vesicle-associated membrane protein 711 [Actinidia rufa]|uniref:Vesicle-associated membrane protein 711 n=1 Tax=Actinidia rufa TaxID=165716 RepID=A0A7J0H0U5_9ERIC|nr:vesicle-associated membrane protein 711 [Actinidia rufa]
MAILYALVARGSVVLAEFSGTSTNAITIARQILEKIPGTNDMNVSYSQDRYIFHVKRTDGLTVLCMADDTAGSDSFEILGLVSDKLKFSYMLGPFESSLVSPISVVFALKKLDSRT